ncbi:MAG: hypothetical protein K0R67_1808, partial [Paenibacillus sp.]|nr:hypothetical protein [Paenibacillus sp.]
QNASFSHPSWDKLQLNLPKFAMVYSGHRTEAAVGALTEIIRRLLTRGGN